MFIMMNEFLLPVVKYGVVRLCSEYFLLQLEMGVLINYDVVLII